MNLRRREHPLPPAGDPAPAAGDGALHQFPWVPDLEWHAWVRYPVSDWSSWSKNRVNRVYNGRVVPARGARTTRDTLAHLVRGATRGVTVAHNRLWLMVHVAKPSHRADAVNVLDMVSDAVQDATGLDDRWYQAVVTWSLYPLVPHVVLLLGQESAQDVLACGRCGRELPPASFTKSRRGRLGRSGTCRECQAAARKK